MAAVRVLIVEDDPVMAMHLEGLVGDAFRAELEICASVAQAEAALRRPFDLALLDVDVADGTTYALAARLAADKVPFAFVSASNMDKMPSGLRGVPFVAKPYSDREILGLLADLGRHGEG